MKSVREEASLNRIHLGTVSINYSGDIPNGIHGASSNTSVSLSLNCIVNAYAAAIKGIINFFSGILCIFVEIILYLWVVEPNLAVKIIVSIFAAVGLVPATIYFLDISFRTLSTINS
jgi:hypothetical protein